MPMSLRRSGVAHRITGQLWWARMMIARCSRTRPLPWATPLVVAASRRVCGSSAQRMSTARPCCASQCSMTWKITLLMCAPSPCLSNLISLG